MKVCINCGVEREDSYFYPHPKKPDLTINSCKPCIKERARKNQLKNREKRRKYLRDYYKENKESILEYNRLRDRRKRKEDDLYRLKYNLSHNLRERVKRLDSSKGSTIDYLGCTIEELLMYLNENPYGFKYGDYGLDIDHKVPTSSATSKEELYLLYHYSNLQLLPTYYNRHIKKNNKFNRENFEIWLKKNRLKN